MRKTLLLFTSLLCLLASQTKAQGYYKFLNNSSWRQSINSGFGIPIDYFYYNQTNDTVISTKTYAKVFCTGTNSTFFVREDTVAKKIYIKTNPTSTELILYDFSLNVGDTLYAQYGWGGGHKLIVRTIDTVTILVGQRRRFNLSDTSGNYFYTAIESVGSINDPFLNNSYPPDDPQYNLVCSYQNNIQVYDAGLFGYTCYSYCGQPCDANFTYTLGLNGQVTFTNEVPVYSCYWNFGIIFGSPDTTVYNTQSVTITFPCNATFTVQSQVTMCPTSPSCYGYSGSGLLPITTVTNGINANYTYTVLANGHINLTNTSTGVNASTNCNWYVQDSTGAVIASSTIISPSFILPMNQNYTITLTENHYPCNSTYTVAVYIPAATGIVKFANNSEQVNIYPNPANNMIYIEMKEIAEIKLCGLLGNEILSTKENEIDVSSLSNGVYFIHVNNYTQKVIIQH